MLKRRSLGFGKQLLAQHSVAIISLVVAILALTLNTERSNRSEHQRTVRDASFRVLAELSAIQLLVDEAHYGEPGRHNPIVGWARINYVRDLTMVIPEPVPSGADSLFEVWQQQVGALGDASNTDASLEANRLISQQVSSARGKVKQVLAELN